MNFEKNTPIASDVENVRISEIFKDPIEKEVMTKAYEKATVLLENESLKPENFAAIYKTELLEKHQHYVEACERRFAENRANSESWARAEIFGKTLEAILHDQINKGVYGEDIRGVSTAAYDDYYAGIDEVIERQSEDGTTHIGFAVDFTFGKPDKKIAKICEEIKAGFLNDIQYYKSPFGNQPQFHEPLKDVPKVVIGMDANHLVQMSNQWVNNEDEALNKNELFLMILRQIQIQSEVYKTIAHKQQKSQVETSYQKVHSVISKLYAEQKEARGVTMLNDDVSRDSVHQAINEAMRKLV